MQKILRILELGRCKQLLGGCVKIQSENYCKSRLCYFLLNDQSARPAII